MWKPKGRLGRMLWSIVRIAVIVYVVFGVILFLFQKRFIYQPRRGVTQTPEIIGVEFETVRLTTADGVSLSAWYVPSSMDRGTVLFCHGNAGNISGRLPTIGKFHALGLNVMIFDYRGYGDSGGSPGEKGTYLDAEAAWDHLIDVRNARPERIVVFGRSLGGAIAAKLAVDRKPAAAILESTFTSIPDLARRMYPVYPTRLLARVRYDTIKRIGDLSCPVLILHSPDDEIIPYAHGRKLFEAAPEPKEFVEMTGGHNDPRPSDYQNILGDFIDKHVSE